MGLIRIAAPAIEPLTIDEVRTHLVLDEINVEPAPSAPAIVVGGTGNVDIGSYRWRLTFVTSAGETQGGDITNAETLESPATVTVDSIPLGGSAVTARRIYRTKAGGDDFFLVGTLANNTATSFVDNVADASLGAGAPSENTTFDPFLVSLIQQARESAENDTRRALITQQWRLTLDCFPDCDVIRLPRPPLISVEAVTYIGFSGDSQTLDPTTYLVDTGSLPGAIARKYGTFFWPLTLPQRNAVTIDFTCGYGPAAADVPEAIKAAMKLFATDLYQNREVVNFERDMQTLPAATRLLGPYRFREVA